MNHGDISDFLPPKSTQSFESSYGRV